MWFSQPLPNKELEYLSNKLPNKLPNKSPYKLPNKQPNKLTNVFQTKYFYIMELL